jgi:hypothetical protein
MKSDEDERTPMSRFIILSLLLLILSSATGCYCFTEPAALSESTIPLEAGAYVELPGTCRGTSSAGLLFGIPLGDVDCMRTARDHALAQSPEADGLIDVSVSYETRIYLGFYSVTDTLLRGKPVKLNEPQRTQAPAGR